MFEVAAARLVEAASATGKEIETALGGGEESELLAAPTSPQDTQSNKRRPDTTSCRLAWARAHFVRFKNNN